MEHHRSITAGDDDDDGALKSSHSDQKCRVNTSRDIGTPPRRTLYVTLSTCGLVKSPVVYPASRNIRSTMQHVEPFPFVPAT